MTLDEIRNQLQQELDDTNVSPYDDEWVQGYERGKESAYRDCIELLNKYNTWHMYPQEKPPKDGELYWVTLDYDDGPRIVTDDLFLNGKFVNYSEYAIVAWAEYNRPKPYVKEDEIKC